MNFPRRKDGGVNGLIALYIKKTIPAADLSVDGVLTVVRTGADQPVHQPGVRLHELARTKAVEEIWGKNSLKCVLLSIINIMLYCRLYNVNCTGAFRVFRLGGGG